MPNGRNGEAVRKRVLEAQKVVVSAILNEWRKEWGMSYVILVHNNGTGGSEVFRRVRVRKEHWASVEASVSETATALQQQDGDVKL